MRIVALITVRNESLYLARCLEHLYKEGIETCLVDNGSQDATLEIAKRFMKKGLFRIEKLPYRGEFRLKEILEFEEALSLKIDADWFMHQDADEIRQAPKGCGSLAEGIRLADKQGANAVNFDEFVFVPTDKAERFEHADYVKNMRYYYFFEPHPFRRVNAWKRHPGIKLAVSGGHRVEFEGRIIFGLPFILRHYMALSFDHAVQKYSHRIYSPYEINALGWFRARVAAQQHPLVLPSKEDLIRLDDDSLWDKARPWKNHALFTRAARAEVAG